MSYLSVPRLVFVGQFQADPSTVNNDPEHFDIDLSEHLERLAGVLETHVTRSGDDNRTGQGHCLHQ